MTFIEAARARLDAAHALDAATDALVVATSAYLAAVDATVAAAPATERELLAHTGVAEQVIGTVADLFPHTGLVTKPGGLRPQAEHDAALLAPLTRGEVG